MNSTFVDYYNINALEPHYLYKATFYNVSSSDLGTEFSYQINNDYCVLNYYVEFSYNQFIYRWSISSYAEDLNTISVMTESLSNLKYDGNYEIVNVQNVSMSNYLNISNNDTSYPVSIIFNLYLEDHMSGASDTFDEAYESGYQAGYTTGYNYGNQVGYDNGYNVGSSANGNFTGVFGLLGQAFNSTSDLYSTSVIGGLTIGGLITIPLAITCVVAIFKILRK